VAAVCVLRIPAFINLQEYLAIQYNTSQMQQSESQQCTHKAVLVNCSVHLHLRMYDLRAMHCYIHHAHCS
jgi:hypothetical protein